ncbi:uncharacterized protein LOC119857184 isoform X2 [Dermochelys coriacea]|uniref:uncharacterized protein LOC119857184 isoform X2 n=1 Tax=Dermochelys coriacea TaxID=27794 RepID=UPI001CA7F7C3|nr:uncharacterized protein LOC119857184 isoform X2 [Dermochelys coriacea]
MHLWPPSHPLPLASPPPLHPRLPLPGSVHSQLAHKPTKYPQGPLQWRWGHHQILHPALCRTGILWAQHRHGGLPPAPCGGCRTPLKSPQLVGEIASFVQMSWTGDIMCQLPHGSSLPVWYQHLGPHHSSLLIHLDLVQALLPQCKVQACLWNSLSLHDAAFFLVSTPSYAGCRPSGPISVWSAPALVRNMVPRKDSSIKEPWHRHHSQGQRPGTA